MMKFKLVESVELARQFVQELAYEAIDELGNKDLTDYLHWFDNQLEYYDLDKEEQEIAVTDFYIEAIDSGKIKRPKTMITSQLKDYIESNSNLLDDVDALIDNCPEHLRHELQLALDVAELNESLNEELLTEEKLYRIGVDNKEFFFIAGNKQEFDSIQDIISYLTLQAIDGHESVDWKLLDELKSYSNYSYSLEIYDNRINLDDNRLYRQINKTFSTTRKRSRRNFIQKISSIVPTNMISNAIVHHVDGNEANEEDSNLIGLFDNTLHQFLHTLNLTKQGTSYSWEGQAPVLVYDGSKYIPKIMKIKLDI